MPELIETAFDLRTQLRCVSREIAMREKVYPKWVEQGRMKQDKADQEIACMKAVQSTLIALMEPNV